MKVLCFICHVLISLGFSVSSKSRKSSYGGVLRNFTQLTSNDTDLEAAIQTGFKVCKIHLKCYIPIGHDGKVHQYTVLKAKLLHVIYTGDDSKAYKDANGQKLIWGKRYYVTILWPEQNLQHSFIVFKNMKGDSYIYKYTFSSLQEHCDSPYIPEEHREISSEYKEDVTETCSYKDSADCMDTTSIINSADRYHPQDGQFCQLNKNTHGLKVLTYNVWNFNVYKGGDSQYRERIKHLCKLVNQTMADVIAFQEVRFQEGKGGKHGPNQVDHLSRLLPQYQFVYQPGQVQYSELPRHVEEGLAIFSKYPIISSNFIKLSRDYGDPADGHQRILLHAMIQTPVQKVHILNTHLSLSHKARQRTVVEIWNVIDSLDGPVLLMGDFNAEAHNDEIRYLDGKSELNGSYTKGLHDVWLLKHPNLPGFTFSTLENTLTKRIDLMFMNDHPAMNLTNVTLLDDASRSKSAASDHLGLLGEFQIMK